MKSLSPAFAILGIALIAGCRQPIIDGADRAVYRMIEDRQPATLAATSDVNIGRENGEVSRGDRIYSFSPRPVPSEAPAAFTNAHGLQDREPSQAHQSADQKETPSADAGMTPGIFSEDDIDRVEVLGLRDALAYAMRHARSLQDAKEDLYLAALDLTLERHLWTPQFVAAVQADVTYSDGGGLNDEERAFEAVSELSATQQLPYGGKLTARIINSLMRDLAEHVASGESGNLMLEADIPLLRGAGRSAYESRYQTERDIIYAVRAFERFRRTFLVEVAARYFNLQQAKASIANTFNSYESRRLDWEKADFISRMGQSRSVFEAPRAKSILRQAEAALVSAKERYESALDQFKIFIGMPVDNLLDVVDQDVDKESAVLDYLFPEVDLADAMDVALRYRLDLLSSADAVDDARRGIIVARNRILPDLDFTGGVTMVTDPDRLNSLSYNNERTTYHGAIELRLDDRKSERNAYRASLINIRRAERDHDLFADSVRADVRRAARRVGQQADLRQIQELQVNENELRLQAARAQFDLGKSTNQDVVDAENDLLAARNQYAAAVAAYRIAILEFRRDTGTLRVADDGRLQAVEGMQSPAPDRTEIADEP